MGTSGNLLWKWGAEKIPAGEAINAKLSGDSGRFSNEDSGDFIKLQPASGFRRCPGVDNTTIDVD